MFCESKTKRLLTFRLLLNAY